MISVVALLTTKQAQKNTAVGEHEFWANQGADYAAKLFAAVARHTPAGTVERFLLTDSPDLCPAGVTPIPLPKMNAPGWWAKLAFFKPKLLPAQKTLYCDLDNLICGDLSPILALEPAPLMMTDDRFYARLPNGSLMLFQPAEMAYVWKDYCQDPEAVQGKYQVWPHAADQAFLSHEVHAHTQHPVLLLQDLVGEGMVVNARTELGTGVPPNARVIIAGANWKPHTVDHPVVREHWRI